MEVVSLDKIVSRVQMTDKDYSQTCLPNTVQGQYPPRPTDQGNTRNTKEKGTESCKRTSPEALTSSQKATGLASQLFFIHLSLGLLHGVHTKP